MYKVKYSALTTLDAAEVTETDLFYQKNSDDCRMYHIPSCIHTRRYIVSAANCAYQLKLVVAIIILFWILFLFKSIVLVSYLLEKV